VIVTAVVLPALALPHGSVRPATPAAPPIGALACATDARCIAVGSGGRAIVSADVGAKRPRWRVTQIARSGDLIAVSCPSSQLCVTVTYGGRVFASHDPFAARARWTRQLVPSAIGVSCPSTGLCVVLDYRPGLTESVDPTDPVPTWSVHPALPGSTMALGSTTGAIACTVAASCAMGTLLGSVAVAHDVGAPRVAARDLGFGEDSTFDGIACPASDRCIAANEDGGIQISAGDGLKRWRRREIGGGAPTFSGASCPTARECLLSDGSGYVWSSSAAFSIHARWRSHAPEPYGSYLAGVACPSPHTCLAFDDRGRIMRSVNPFARSASWTTIGRAGPA
jgi:hypothetical protein